MLASPSKVLRGQQEQVCTIYWGDPCPRACKLQTWLLMRRDGDLLAWVAGTHARQACTAAPTTSARSSTTWPSLEPSLTHGLIFADHQMPLQIGREPDLSCLMTAILLQQLRTYKVCLESWYTAQLWRDKLRSICAAGVHCCAVTLNDLVGKQPTQFLRSGSTRGPASPGTSVRGPSGTSLVAGKPSCLIAA